MPFCVIDTEGEYSSLKSIFNVIVVGRENQDVGFDVNYTKLFRSSIVNDVPVIIDVSDAIDKKEIAYKALEALYELESEIRKPYLVLIEEGDKFAPQTASKTRNIIEEISVRGRKRGIGLLVATQRPANISKNVLSQCSYGFIGKLTIENDLNAIKILFEDREKLVEITRLKTGQFIPFGLEYNKKFQVKGRSVKHMGLTPTIGDGRPIDIKLSKILNDLKGAEKERLRIKKEGPIEPVEIFAITNSFTARDVNGYVEKIKKKQFGIFGKTTENLDTIKLEYMPLGLSNFRIRTGKKNEYLEYWTLIDENGELIRLDRGIRSIVQDDLAKAAKWGYKDYLNKESPVIEKIEVNKSDLLKTNIDQKHVRKSLIRFFPDAIFVDFKLMYVPIYRIVLKNDNKVRVFVLDGIYGKEVEII